MAANNYYGGFNHVSSGGLSQGQQQQQQYSSVGYAGGYPPNYSSPAARSQMISYSDSPPAASLFGAYDAVNKEPPYEYMSSPLSIPSYTVPDSSSSKFSLTNNRSSQQNPGLFKSGERTGDRSPYQPRSGPPHYSVLPEDLNSFGSSPSKEHQSMKTPESLQTSGAYGGGPYGREHINQAKMMASNSSYPGVGVYATGNSFFHQKMGAGPGSTSVGGQLLTGVGNWQRRNPPPFQFGQRPKIHKTPKPSQLHYCEVCKISCAGAQTYMEHLEGKNHKKRETQAKNNSLMDAKAAAAATAASLSNNGSTNNDVCHLYCQLCDVACTGLDTYVAHVRGAKHQKVLNLHKKLGKPIPDMPDVDLTKLNAAMNAKSTSQAKAGPANGNSAETKEDENDESAVPADEEECVSKEEGDVAQQLIGLEYIEESRSKTGTAASFYCRLCDCHFTDPLAKIMHIKGRRHRLAYKQKVDPSLQVDVKMSAYHQVWRIKQRMAAEQEWKRRQMENVYRKQVEELRYEKEILQWQLSQTMADRSFDQSCSGSPRSTMDDKDDKYILAKHAEIYPNEADLAAVQKTVSDCEKALKLVSDLFAESNASKETAENPLEASDGDKKSEKPVSTQILQRELKGVMRVGVLAKGLLLHDDLDFELVLLCLQRPTRSLLMRLLDELPKQMATFTQSKYDISLSADTEGITLVSHTEPKLKCNIYLTSPAVKGVHLNCEVDSSSPQADDYLSRQGCLRALADLRHSKWFQAKANPLQSCVILIRIFRDFIKRFPLWRPLSDWAIELLVEKCLSSQSMSRSPGSGIRRIFECIGSGILLSGGAGLLDPCEKEPTDAVEGLSIQEREDITHSAQHALRQIVFGQIGKVLGMEKLPHSESHSHQRKRPLADASTTAENATATDSSNSA